METSGSFTRAFSRWAKKGVWQRIFEVLPSNADNEYQAINSSIVRAHQHSAGATGSCADAEEIGRSRGGLSTKVIFKRTAFDFLPLQVHSCVSHHKFVESLHQFVF